MLAAPVSQLPWMTSILTTPLGKCPSAFTTLLVSPPPAQGLHPYLPTYQAVWLLELTQSMESFWTVEPWCLGGGASFCKCLR